MEEATWGFPRIDGDFWLGMDGEFLVCCAEKDEAWPVLLFAEADDVLGLPLAPLETEEVVGEPTIGVVWLVLGCACPCEGAEGF